MFRYKKTAALIMSLLICASAPVYSAYADNETETVTESEAVAETDDSAESEIKVSGDFSYSLTEEGTACIEDCTSTVEDLVIPDKIDGYTVAELGSTALGSEDKTPFKTVTIPATIEYISASGPFAVCPHLKEIKVDSKSEYFTAVDGVLYTKDMTEIVAFPSKHSNATYTVPEGVKKVRGAAFYFNEQ